MQPGGHGAATRVSRPAGRRHRQPRVLHRDAAGRAQRSLVHARQRAHLPGCAGARARARAAHRAADRQRRSLCQDAADRRRRRRPWIRTDDRRHPAAGASAASRRCWRPRTGSCAHGADRARSGADSAVHGGGQRGSGQDPAAVPDLGSQSARERGAADGAALVPHAQGQRPHGQCARVQRIRLGNRESAQSHHRRHAAALAAGAGDAANGSGGIADSWSRSWSPATAGRTDVSRLAARAHALASGRDVSTAPPPEAAQPLPPAFPRDSVMPGAALELPAAASPPAAAEPPTGATEAAPSTAAAAVPPSPPAAPEPEPESS